MDFTTIARNVLEFIAAEGVELSDDLTAAEQTLRDAVLRIGAKALEEHLSHKRLGYEGSSRPCDSPACGKKHLNQKFVAHRPRTVQTLMGQVTFARAYYHCKHCGASCCPYDQSVGLGPGQLSVGLAKASALVAAMDPFVPAARVLHELTGQRVGDRTMHRDQWNEAKCVCCYWEEAGSDGTPVGHARYAARFESAEAFKGYVWSLASRCGLEGAAEVVLLGDGAAWIWDHVAGVLGERTVCITDWYHVMEHLWACGNALHGQGTPGAAAWVEERETLLWEGRCADLIVRLDAERRKMRSLPKHRALADLSGYLSNQGDRLAYDRFRAAGYDIGSGRAESACKHVVQMRMKRNGMIWSNDGAQDVLSLRTAYLNGAWNRLWAQKPLLAKTAA